jgi:hypothetical protein
MAAAMNTDNHRPHPVEPGITDWEKVANVLAPLFFVGKKAPSKAQCSARATTVRRRLRTGMTKHGELEAANKLAGKGTVNKERAAKKAAKTEGITLEEARANAAAAAAVKAAAAAAAAAAAKEKKEKKDAAAVKAAAEKAAAWQLGLQQLEDPDSSQWDTMATLQTMADDVQNDDEFLLVVKKSQRTSREFADAQRESVSVAREEMEAPTTAVAEAAAVARLDTLLSARRRMGKLNTGTFRRARLSLLKAKAQAKLAEGKEEKEDQEGKENGGGEGGNSPAGGEGGGEGGGERSKKIRTRGGDE